MFWKYFGWVRGEKTIEWLVNHKVDCRDMEYYDSFWLNFPRRAKCEVALCQRAHESISPITDGKNAKYFVDRRADHGDCEAIRWCANLCSVDTRRWTDKDFDHLLQSIVISGSVQTLKIIADLNDPRFKRSLMPMFYQAVRRGHCNLLRYFLEESPLKPSLDFFMEEEDPDFEINLWMGITVSNFRQAPVNRGDLWTGLQWLVDHRLLVISDRSMERMRNGVKGQPRIFESASAFINKQ